ncbi:hypothetical protein [Streptomyces decoyicus]
MSDPFAADPFAETNPWEIGQPAAQAATDTSRPEAPMSDGNKVRVTLKAGKGFDAPWITIDGTSIEDALAQMQKGQPLMELLTRTAQVGSHFASLGEGGARPASAASPVAPPQFVNGQLQGGGVPAPAAPAPAPASGGLVCAHGPRNHVVKPNWEAMFCSAPQGTPEEQKCAPMWKDKKTGQFK